MLHPIFNALRPEDRSLLLSNQRAQEIPADKTLLNAGDPCGDVFFVASGKFRVETPSDNARTVSLTGFLQPGDIYVERLTQPNYPASNSLRAALSSTVHKLPISLVAQVVKKCPEVGLELLQHSIQNVTRLRKQLRRVKSDTVRTKVARALYDVAATTADGARVLDRKITQSDLAEFTGLSREAVNKELKQLSDAELLRRSARGLEVASTLGSTDFLPWNDKRRP